MDGSSVMLNGFGDFLDGRAIHFVGTRPKKNLCDSCGVLNFSINLSECSHAFCLACSEMIFNLRSSLCPLDGQSVSLENVKVSRLDESAVAEYPVRCLNAPHGCQFEGSLAELEQHVLQHCLYNLVNCWKCKKWMTLSQFAEHTVRCSVPATAKVLPSKASDRIRRRETKGAVNGTRDSSKTASGPVYAAVNGALSKEAAREEHNYACNASPKDQTPPLMPKCPPLPLDDGVVKLSSHQRPYEVERLEADASKAISAISSPISSGTKASDTNGSLSTPCKADSDDESEISEETKYAARQKNLGLRMKRLTKLGATASNAASINTAFMSGPNDRTPANAVLLTWLSGALEKSACPPFDASIPPQEKAEGDHHFSMNTAIVPKRSLERSTVARLQAVSELATRTVDSDSEEQSARLNAESNACASGNSALVASSQRSRVHDSGNTVRENGTGHTSGLTIREEANGAFGSGATSYAGPSTGEYVPQQILEEMYRFRKVTFPFSVPVGVSTLKSEKQMVTLSERGILFGYTFRTTCHFRGLGGLTLLAFGLFLCSGEYDDFCPWPFDMRVIIEVVHPRKGARNMRVQLRCGRAVEATAMRKLGPGSANPNFMSQYYAWNSVARAGFLKDGTLRVEVMFE